ncbi:MAG: RnfH family protein [Burkholderiales bacterium]|nr:RnfH family protein [Burkholderiales bacterium]
MPLPARRSRPWSARCSTRSPIPSSTRSCAAPRPSTVSADRPGPATPLRVEVVYCPAPGLTDRVGVQLAAGATVADALRASGLLTRHALAAEGLQVGVWSRRRTLQTALREGDRVEIYRPLTVDPKEARRRRQRRQLSGSPTR